jgi:hypothetical protein
MSALEVCMTSEARRVGLPVFGTGAIGVSPEVAARAVVAATRRVLDEREGLLDEVIFVTADPKVSDAIEEAWSQLAAGGVLRMLADRPIDDPMDDHLGIAPYAEALARLVANRDTYTPLTIAINAPWGAGKTSLARMVHYYLARGKDPTRLPVVCWFDAWLNDQAPDLGAALACCVARDIACARPLWRRLVSPVPPTMLDTAARRRRWLLKLTVSIILLGVAVLVIWRSGLASDTSSHVGLPILGVVLLTFEGAVLFLDRLSGPMKTLASFVQKPDATAALGASQQVRRELGVLVAQATKKRRRAHHERVVVFVDDLERCRPTRAIDVCEVTNQLLCHPNVVVVLLADLPALHTCVEMRYGKLLGRYTPSGKAGDDPAGPAGFGQSYLEKIVQFRLDLPAFSAVEIHRLVRPTQNGDRKLVKATARNLAAGSNYHPPRRQWSQLRVFKPVGGLLTRNRSTWTDESVNTLDAAVDSASNREEKEGSIARDDSREENDMLNRALEEAESHATYVLPRDVKRLVNRIRFSIYLAATAGLLNPSNDGITPEQLGKWAVLSERWPEFAYAIGVAPDELSSIENADNESVSRANIVALCGCPPDVDGLVKIVRAAPKCGSVVSDLFRLRARSTPSDASALIPS